MIQYESLDQSRIDVGEMLHLHQFDHVKIDRLVRHLIHLHPLPLLPCTRCQRNDLLSANFINSPKLSNRQHRLDQRSRQRSSEGLMKFRRKRRVGDVDEDFDVGVMNIEGDFEGIEESGRGVFGEFESVGEDSGMDSFGGVAFGLLQHFPCSAHRLASMLAFRERRSDETDQRGGRQK